MEGGMLSDTPEGARGVEVTVVLPVFEEQDRIAGILQELVQTLQASGRTYEVIAVDDGSSDGTPDSLQRALEAALGRVRVARHLENRGNGAALRTGVRLALGEVGVTMGAGGQRSPAG